MDGKIAKEAFIIILLLIVVMFVLGILLYDFIPGKKQNIKSVEYVAEDSVNNVLKEIEESTGIDIQGNSSEVPLKSYSIESQDLEAYASENSYESGKSDPFAEESNPAEGITRVVPSASKAEQETKNTKQEQTKEPAKEASQETTKEPAKEATTNNTVNNTTTKNSSASNTTKVENTTKTTKEEKKDESKTSSTGKYFEQADKK